MPTSATGTDVIPAKAGIQPKGARLASSAGFTLIEVLIVVAISGILLAVAAVNLFPSDEQLSRREAADVAAAVEKARDTAWFGGMPTAVSFEQGAVHRWRLSGQEWQAQGANAPGSVRVQALHVDGQPLDPRERLVFLPDGLGVPFRLTLEARGLAWSVEGDAAGAIRLVRR